VDDPGIMAAIGTVVTRANQAVSRAEQVRKFRILLADIKEETGHLTPTLKLKRDAFLRDFHEFVEELYHGGKTHHGGTA
jgi:Long-chain acyl-CoA synthetases (AMP-forming)